MVWANFAHTVAMVALEAGAETQVSPQQDVKWIQELNDQLRKSFARAWIFAYGNPEAARMQAAAG